jgi:hypothetical protein
MSCLRAPERRAKELKDIHVINRLTHRKISELADDRCHGCHLDANNTFQYTFLLLQQYCIVATATIAMIDAKSDLACVCVPLSQCSDGT